MHVLVNSRGARNPGDAPASGATSVTPAPDANGTSVGPSSAVTLLTRGRLFSDGTALGSVEDATSRTAYFGLVAATFRSTLIVMQRGQRSPPRTSDIEHVIVGLEGAFVFTIDGVEYRVEPVDQLFVPIGVVWEYVNAVESPSAYLAIVGP